MWKVITHTQDLRLRAKGRMFEIENVKIEIGLNWLTLDYISVFSERSDNRRPKCCHLQSCTRNP